MVTVRTGRGAAPLLLVSLLALGFSACAHHTVAPPSGPGQRFQASADGVNQIVFEDQFIEARLVLQALPPKAPERAPLRAKLLRYLAEPLRPLSADRLRREAVELSSTDIFDRVFESLRDAAGLYEPSEIWDARDAIPADEREGLARAARLTLDIFAPRGGEAQVALALSVLTTLEPTNAEWSKRLDAVLAWSEDAGSVSESPRPHAVTTAIDLLRSVLGDWPAPAVADRLARFYSSRQQKFSSILRKPMTTDDAAARRALGDLLLAQADEMQSAVASVAAIYLRCARLDRAIAATTPLANKPGDDPELRALLAAAAAANAPAEAYLKLARRFLPRVELFGGTASDAADPTAAFRVLQMGLLVAPNHVEMLVLSAETAKVLSSPFLAMRQLEEAQQVPDQSAVPLELQGRIASELLDLYFLRLRLQLDPERGALPREADVEALRRMAASARERFPKTEFRIRDSQIDFEVAKSYMNAGQLDKAEPLFARAQADEPELNADVTVERGTLIMKRGDPQRAVTILRDGLQALRALSAQQETIGRVEGQARIEKLLGDALELAGDQTAADRARRGAVTSWERLMIEHLRRRNFSRSAEATFEVGRLLYLLGRHADGLQKFDEAIEQDDDRDQSYIDAVSFLVQNGEADAALNVYRRALSRPDQSVSEYVKVYASLWIYDLTRRTQHMADPSADTLLRSLDQRHPEVRPQRGATWYRKLAAFTVGKLPYEQLIRQADSLGKQAEAYFYRSMQVLADGKTDEAYVLWRKVLDTRMVSFFEFEMASRYLRMGAPTAPTPEPEARPPTETI